MKRVILLSGLPGAGKTFLASRLATEHQFGVLCLDDAYVDFIKSHCSMLYFDVLDMYVGPHYNSILVNRNYSIRHFQRDFVAEWHSFLLARAEQQLTQTDRLVLEGYLLKDCMASLQLGLQTEAQVFHVLVANRNYYCQQQICTFQQVAALGTAEIARS